MCVHMYSMYSINRRVRGPLLREQVGVTVLASHLLGTICINDCAVRRPWLETSLPPLASLYSSSASQLR